MATGRFVAYYRVSTDRQGRSGLGLEAQQKVVADYLNGGNWTLLAEFTEIESGKRNDRPELTRALVLCRKSKATLLIAKLDRLARNARFLLGIIESGVDVMFCDLPSIPAGPTGKFILTQMAAVAELEAALIAARTKDALAAAKARGKRLGWSIEGREGQQPEVARKGVMTNQRKADAHAANILPVIRQIQASGAVSLREIATALNVRGIPTARGSQWYPTTVKNLIER